MKEAFWCTAYINEIAQRVKVQYKGRGKFEVVEDMLGDNVKRIIDAADIIKIED